METAITWGSYAEIFYYDYNAGVLMLPEEEVEEMEAEDEAREDMDLRE
jgi:NitT/TauT family transport system ATP-binding protein